MPTVSSTSSGRPLMKNPAELPLRGRTAGPEQRRGHKQYPRILTHPGEPSSKKSKNSMRLWRRLEDLQPISAERNELGLVQRPRIRLPTTGTRTLASFFRTGPCSPRPPYQVGG